MSWAGWKQVTIYSAVQVEWACMQIDVAREMESLRVTGAMTHRWQRERLESAVVATVLLSCAAMEAAVNEVFLDAVHDISKPLPRKTDPALLARIAAMWNTDADRLSVEGKAQALLAAFQAEPLGRGAAPLQDARLLIQMRNALAHAKSEPHEYDESQERWDGPGNRLEGKLRGKYVILDTDDLWSKMPFLPHRAFSFGCSEWALRTAVAFIDDLYARLGAKSSVDGIRQIVKEALEGGGRRTES